MRKHPRQDIEAALDALLKEPAPEALPRADGWAAVQPLWRRQLYLIGRGKRLQDANIEDRIQEVFAAILARWEEHRQLGVTRLLALSRKMMHDKVVDEIRRRDRQRARGGSPHRGKASSRRLACAVNRHGIAKKKNRIVATPPAVSDGYREYRVEGGTRSARDGERGRHGERLCSPDGIPGQEIRAAPGLSGIGMADSICGPSSDL